MNKKRRGMVRDASVLLTRALDLIDRAKDEESDCLSNYPENLQSSDAYYNMEDAVDYLSDASYGIQDVLRSVERVLDC